MPGVAPKILRLEVLELDGRRAELVKVEVKQVSDKEPDEDSEDESEADDE